MVNQPSQIKPFFHELDVTTFKAMQAIGCTWADVRRDFAPPTWCGVGEEALGAMGCWSLVGRNIRCEHDCAGCDEKLTHEATK